MGSELGNVNLYNLYIVSEFEIIELFSYATAIANKDT